MNNYENKKSFCMNFNNEELLEFFVAPLSKYPKVNIHLFSSDDVEIFHDSTEKIEYITFDGEIGESEFYISFLGCQTSIFLLNEEFMFIDDDAKETYSSSDTYNNVVYEGLLKNKTPKEILELLCDIIVVLVGTKEISITESLISQADIQYPKNDYIVKISNGSGIKDRTKFDNIMFVING